MIGVSRKQAWSRKRDGGRTEAEYRYYRCGSRVNQSVCAYHTWRADDLERQVVDVLAEQLAAAPPERPSVSRSQHRTSLTTRLRALDTRLERQLDAVARGTRPLDQLRAAALPLVREARRLERRLRALEGDGDGWRFERAWWEQQRETLRELRTEWRQLSSEERRFYMSDLLERATVYDDRVEIALS